MEVRFTLAVAEIENQGGNIVESKTASILKSVKPEDIERAFENALKEMFPDKKVEEGRLETKIHCYIENADFNYKEDVSKFELLISAARFTYLEKP